MKRKNASIFREGIIVIYFCVCVVMYSKTMKNISTQKDFVVLC